MKASYMLRYEYLKSIPAKFGFFQSHDNYEIFYFHEGRGNYLIGDKIHSLVPGTLILMHGITLHSPCSFDGFPYIRTLINFDQAYVQAAGEFLFKVNVLEPFERLGNVKLTLEEEQRVELEGLLEKMNRFLRPTGPCGLRTVSARVSRYAVLYLFAIKTAAAHAA